MLRKVHDYKLHGCICVCDTLLLSAYCPTAQKYFAYMPVVQCTAVSLSLCNTCLFYLSMRWWHH